MKDRISDSAKKDLKGIVDEIFYTDLSEKTTSVENKLKELDVLKGSISQLNTKVNDIRTDLTKVVSSQENMLDLLNDPDYGTKSIKKETSASLTDLKKINDKLEETEKFLSTYIIENKQEQMDTLISSKLELKKVIIINTVLSGLVLLLFIILFLIGKI